MMVSILNSITGKLFVSEQSRWIPLDRLLFWSILDVKLAGLGWAKSCSLTMHLVIEPKVRLGPAHVPKDGLFVKFQPPSVLIKQLSV